MWLLDADLVVPVDAVPGLAEPGDVAAGKEAVALGAKGESRSPAPLRREATHRDLRVGHGSSGGSWVHPRPGAVGGVGVAWV